MKSQRIAIIGAGTAGLATAALLAKQQHDVTVFEKADALEPVGAGLLLQPSGLAVLKHMDALNEMLSWGAPVTGLVGVLPESHDYQKVVNSFYHDADLSTELGDFARLGLGVHRASLCHVLAQACTDVSNTAHVPITWKMAHHVMYIEHHDTSSTLVVNKTIDGETTSDRLSFDCVLVCNGARSQLRPEAWTVLDKPYPWGAIWAIVPECEMLDKQVLHQFYDGADTMMGILPTGKQPEQTLDTRKPLSSVFWSLPTKSLPKASTSSQKITQTLCHATQTRWPDVSAWLSQLPEDTHWLSARYRDVVMSQFGEHRMGVLGDAAHAMSPQLGQGANMALLDAWAISHAMHHSDSYAELWQRYHALRLPSIRFYQRMSRMLTPFYQSQSRSLGILRDASFTWMYRIPWLRKHMALTVSGVKTGLLNEISLDEIVAPFSTADLKIPN